MLASIPHNAMSFPPEDWTQWFIVLAGISIGFALWISLFTAGILVDSEPYRRVISSQGVEEMSTAASAGQATASSDPLSAPPQSGSPTAPPEAAAPTGTTTADSPPTDSVLWAFIVALLCFTPSNLAFLCCLAGVLGAMGRRVVLSTQRGQGNRDRTYPLLSALLRSFFVYLTVISGLLVLLENPILGTASPGQYIRFAGLLSLIGFFVSYDPTMFVALLDRVRDRMQENTEGDLSVNTSEDAPEKNE